MLGPGQASGAGASLALPASLSLLSTVTCANLLRPVSSCPCSRLGWVPPPPSISPSLCSTWKEGRGLGAEGGGFPLWQSQGWGAGLAPRAA